MAPDKTLTCRDCGADFVFTESEQEFFAEKGFANDPGRCPECRAARRNSGYQQRKMYDVNCAACGVKCQVPFRPREERPVYCSDCYQSHHHGR